jgi:hypothetical protein
LLPPAAFLVAIEMCGRLKDVAGMVEMRPTREGFRASALKLPGHALHI